MPCSRAHARMASDRPGGAVFDAALGSGAPDRPLAEDARRGTAFFLPRPLLAVEDDETDVSSSFVERLSGFLRLRPVADRRADFFAACPTMASPSGCASEVPCSLRPVPCRP